MKNDNKSLVMVTFWIPIFITIMCVCFEFANFTEQELGIIKTVQTLLMMLISYFFPTFFSAAVTCIITYYVFEEKETGIRKEKFPAFCVFTILYFFAYIFYWKGHNLLPYIAFFSICSILYAYFVMKKCVDKEFSLVRMIINAKDTKVKNAPN